MKLVFTRPLTKTHRARRYLLRMLINYLEQYEIYASEETITDLEYNDFHNFWSFNLWPKPTFKGSDKDWWKTVVQVFEDEGYRVRTNNTWTWKKKGTEPSEYVPGLSIWITPKEATIHNSELRPCLEELDLGDWSKALLVNTCSDTTVLSVPRKNRRTGYLVDTVFSLEAGCRFDDYEGRSAAYKILNLIKHCVSYYQEQNKNKLTAANSASVEQDA